MKLSIAVISLAGLLVAPLVAQSGRALIVQTNSAGDSVMLIDPATDKIVGRDSRGRGRSRRRGGAGRQPPLSEQRGAEHGRRRRYEDHARHQADPAQRPPEQHRDSQGRPARLRRDHRRAGRRRRDRHRGPGANEDHPDSRRRAQPVHHAGQQVRRGRFHRRLGRDRDRYRAGAAGLVDPFRGRRPADLLRDQPRRLDQADVRRRSPTSTASPSSTGRSERKSAGSICPICRRRSATTRAFRARRRTAS